MLDAAGVATSVSETFWSRSTAADSVVTGDCSSRIIVLVVAGAQQDCSRDGQSQGGVAKGAGHGCFPVIMICVATIGLYLHVAMWGYRNIENNANNSHWRVICGEQYSFYPFHYGDRSNEQCDLAGRNIPIPVPGMARVAGVGAQPWR